MTLIYKILSGIVNAVAMFLFIILIFTFPLLLGMPVALLPAFMLVAVVLYSWFSNKFHQKVLQKQETVKRSLWDWVRVNGIVGIVFSIILFIDSVSLLKNPGLLAEAMKGYNVEPEMKNFQAVFIAMLIYSIFLLIHILWTFSLMKKFKNYFQ